MPAAPFVWFDLRTPDTTTAREFYAQLLGWQVQDVPAGDTTIPMVMGAEGPWASFAAPADAEPRPHWLPYVEVDDVAHATEQATKLGARVLQPLAAGPAGNYVTIADPTGAPVVLWQAGER